MILEQSFITDNSVKLDLASTTGWRAAIHGVAKSWDMTEREGNGYLFHYSCLENFMDRGAWQAKVHGDHKKSDTTE